MFGFHTKHSSMKKTNEHALRPHLPSAVIELKITPKKESLSEKRKAASRKADGYADYLPDLCHKACDVS